MNDTRVRFMIQRSLIDLNLLHISDIVFILEMQLIRKKVEESIIDDILAAVAYRSCPSRHLTKKKVTIDVIVGQYWR